MKKTENTIGVKVPFFPAKLEYLSIKDELHQDLDMIGLSGRYILGEMVNRFENRLAAEVGVKYAVGCASGTDALTLSLKALGIGPKDEVIVPANVYPTIFGVALSGAKLRLVDVLKNSGNIDPDDLELRITKETKAIVTVHLYGLPADLKQIKQTCLKHNLFLIEDCAQAFGAKYLGKSVGSFGNLAIFSFYPTKNLGAIGDGGAVVTNNKQLYEKLKMLRMYGEKKRYDSQLVGMNSRLDEIQAAFLLTKLKYSPQWLSRKKYLAKIYLKELSLLKDLDLPLTTIDREHTYHLFVIKTKKRNQLQEWLTKQGIETGIHYPIPIHFTKPFSYLGKNNSFPHAEEWSDEALSLPLHPFLSRGQIKYVVKKVKEFFINSS